MKTSTVTKLNLKWLAETIIWLFLATIVLIKPLLSLPKYQRYTDYSHWVDYNSFLSEHYWEFIISFSLALFPILFRMIYSQSPLGLLSQRFIYSRIFKSDSHKEADLPNFELNINAEYHTKDTTNKEINENQESILIQKYLKQSEIIANKIFSRSSAYLLIGCLIAFAGVLLFYFQSTYVHQIEIKQSLDFSQTILQYVPRLGTLIFVEAIAFFFLKQYKSTMEEYRYYDAIKRQRENQYAILLISQKPDQTLELSNNLIEKLSFNYNPNKLGPSETTQILEANKLKAPEIDAIDKLIEVLKLMKK